MNAVDLFGYNKMPRAKLLRHVKAYAHGIHSLAKDAMRLQRKVEALEKRLSDRDKFREVLHG